MIQISMTINIYSNPVNHTDSSQNPHHLCLLVYNVPPGFKLLTVQPHGNFRSNKPFYATWPGTLKMVKEEVKDSEPIEAVAVVLQKVGGLLPARASGQLPRGEMQATKAKRSLKFH